MKELFDAIEESKHICVVAHKNPDIDSLSSASAMYSYLMQRHKKASFACVSSELPRNANFLPWFDKIRQQMHTSVDLVIALDCGSYSRIGFDVTCRLINIDHHASNERYGDIAVVDSCATSSAEVLFDLFKKQGVKINLKMATALYAGLLDDSRRFLHVDSEHKLFAHAQELVALGADVSLCNRAIFQERSLASLRLKGWMLERFELYKEARIAFIHVDEEAFRQSGASPYDCQEPLEEILGFVHAKVAILMRDMQNGQKKYSLRSKGDIAVNAIASCFGGGGHKNAAGFVHDENIKESIIEFISKELDA